MTDSIDRAILFLNLGGPGSPKEVRPFLYRLFSDPEIIRIPFSPVRKLVALMIALGREKKATQHYQLIGGGSPIRRLTDEQAAATQTRLEQKGNPALVRTAFTCSAPLVEDVVKDLGKKGIKNFLAFPLYPQYSLTTTKSALDRTRAAVKRYAPHATLTEIRSWHTHPLFINAHAELLRAHARRFPSSEDKDIMLLFSAHSIPEKLVTQCGDPYRDQMERTVKSVVEKAEWTGPWTLSWQSKLGPVKWLEPSTEETVRKLGREGVKQILVVPIAFVTDHIETLVELDIELMETARENGVRELKRVPGLNNHPLFIEALADLAMHQKDFWTPS